ncbi:MAG: Hsp70 family protein, partial [Candidatus Sumerlaeota bacterium]
EGIPPAPRGVPQIEVTFDIDSNGIVHVSAKDQGTGKEQKIRIEASSGLDESQIDDMIKDAEAHEEEDRRVKEESTTRNQAESLIYSVEKSLDEYKDKVDQADVDKINSAIEDLKKALDGQDIEEIKTKMEALNQASHKISELLYKQAQEGMGGAEQAQAGAAGGPGPEAAAGATAGAAGEEDEEIVDAEFEVEDENK